MTREQMYADILAAINRKPAIGVHCMSVDAFKTLSTVETLQVLQGYADDLWNEHTNVQRAIAAFLLIEVDHDRT